MLFIHPAHAEPIPARNRSVPRPGRGTRLDDFVATVYLPYHQLHKRSWQVDERIARQHLSPFFGGRHMTDISSMEVAAWQRSLADKKLAPSTCNRILAVFKSICTMAEAQGVLRQGSSPCRGVSPLRTPPEPERHLSKAQALRLLQVLEAADQPAADALRLLLLTGARKNEILKARWEYVRLDLHLLMVPLSKSGKVRYIALSDEAVAIIRNLQGRSDSPWLFPGRSPARPLSDLYYYWNRVRQSLGLQGVRIHDLRHTFASFLVNERHSLYEVQQLLGHADPRTTMRYAHLDQSSLLAAAETVSRCLRPEETTEQQSTEQTASEPTEHCPQPKKEKKRQTGKQKGRGDRGTRRRKQKKGLKKARIKARDKRRLH